MRVVFCTWFLLFSFALGSFYAFSLYRCVNCFSVFVLFVRMEIIIIITIVFRISFRTGVTVEVNITVLVKNVINVTFIYRILANVCHLLLNNSVPCCP